MLAVYDIVVSPVKRRFTALARTSLSHFLRYLRGFFVYRGRRKYLSLSLPGSKGCCGNVRRMYTRRNSPQLLEPIYSGLALHSEVVVGAALLSLPPPLRYSSATRNTVLRAELGMYRLKAKETWER